MCILKNKKYRRGGEIMENRGIESLKKLINRIEITDENKEEIEQINHYINEKNYKRAIEVLEQLKNRGNIKLLSLSSQRNEPINEDEERIFNEEFIPEEIEEEEQEEKNEIYPKELLNRELEEKYIGLLLENPKAISMYYILHEDCYFESDNLLNLYKSILFTEGQAYAPQIAKNEFNFAKEDAETYKQKIELKEKIRQGNYDFENTYVELRKLFEIRKNYLSSPIKETQREIIDILKYELYNQ